MNAKCYTFYSYKGGSGRTTTLLNTTKHLADVLHASKEHPILLVDADLESAGLTYFFGCKKRFTARFNYTLNAESFLNNAGMFCRDFTGKVTFGVSKERLFSTDAIAERIARLCSSATDGAEASKEKADDIKSLFKDVYIRQTTHKLMEDILSMKEKEEQHKEDIGYLNFCKSYDMNSLLRCLADIRSTESAEDALKKKREAIEAFLPADSMEDVSRFFGFEYGTIKFIGVDTRFSGIHATLENQKAAINKNIIAAECGKRGFSAVLFDSGAGVQSTAHVLNHVSDVLVYCMRPTSQFCSGTSMQLINYQQSLAAIAKANNEKAEDRGEPTGKKAVIILPTAVPYETEETKKLQSHSFSRIEDMSKLFGSFVDDTFCSYARSLKEVSLFKWRECILGVDPKSVETLSDEFRSVLQPYFEYDSMPADAKEAYRTYRLLAERLCYNS